MAAKRNGSGGTKAAHKATTGKQALPPVVVIPETGWSVQWKHGTLRCADGDAARLVRLADVVRHLMTARELPFKDAVESVCSTLAAGHGFRLYRVDERGYARALDERAPESDGWDKFLEVPEDSAGRLAYFSKRAAELLRASWLIQPYELARLVNNPEFPSDDDYQETKESPFDFSERRGDHGSRYAVTFRVAHELWGWGMDDSKIEEPETYDDLRAHYAWWVKNKPGEAFDWKKISRCKLVVDEVSNRGRGGATSVAKDFGFARQNVQKIRDRYEKHKHEHPDEFAKSVIVNPFGLVAGGR